MKSLFHVFSIHVNLFIVWMFFSPRLLDFYNPSLTSVITRRKKLNVSSFFIEIFCAVIKALVG